MFKGKLFTETKLCSSSDIPWKYLSLALLNVFLVCIHQDSVQIQLSGIAYEPLPLKFPTSVPFSKAMKFWVQKQVAGSRPLKAVLATPVSGPPLSASRSATTRGACHTFLLPRTPAWFLHHSGLDTPLKLSRKKPFPLIVICLDFISLAWKLTQKSSNSRQFYICQAFFPFPPATAACQNPSEHPL